MQDCYRQGIDQWRKSISYEDNPLWNYIYQLSRPNEKVVNAYGEEINAQSAWTLSRHVIDTTRYLASNSKRDDYGEFNALNYGIFGIILNLGTMPITVDLNKTDSEVAKRLVNGKTMSDFLYIVTNADKIVYGIPAPDERNTKQVRTWFDLPQRR